MARKMMLMLLASAMLMGSVEAQNNVFSLSGKVTDKSGRGISGVAVNDGVNFTTTDAKGQWTLRTDTFVSKFVSITTPAAYRLPQKDGLAQDFYVPVKTAVAQHRHNFVLEKRDKVNDDFYYIAISDPQVRNENDMRRWTTETTPDLRQMVYSLKKKREVVGMTLGDLVWDNMPLYAEYTASIKNMGMTLFQCIGNHDFDKRYQDLHNMRLGTPVYGEMVYNRWFGPTDYSFNMGKAHIVTMKNINYLGNKKYVEDITDAQFAWLEKDLSYVPKGSLVILNMHAAGWNRVQPDGNVRNAARLAELLSGYNVHVFCGHTHFFQNVEVSPSLYQHNIGAACGAWWTGWINRCGAPDGYMVVDVNGSDVEWKYKPTGFDLSYQMKLYDKGEFSTQADCVVANVWDADSKTTVEWWQDGKPMGKMEQFVDVDEGYNSRYKKYKEDSKTPHLFRCRPFGLYKEIKVVVTDRFGRSFTDYIRPQTRVIAHRGGAGLYPENTIDAMLNAIDLGVRDLEMDMHITKDSVVVVSHDPYVKGYGKQYPIYSLSWNELRQMTTGDKFDPKFPNSKRVKSHVPMVTELIDSVEAYCHRRHIQPVKYTIEIKSSKSSDNVLSPEYKVFTDLCMKALNSRSLGSRLLLQSFDLRTLRYVHEKWPNVHLLYLTEKESGTYQQAIKALGFKPFAISDDSPYTDKAFVEAAHTDGVGVIPYTVDDKAEAQRLKACGVDAIITNYPDKMFEWVK